MKENNEKLWVCTDLDGSLLDHSYSWDEARPSLELLKKSEIPLILNSSKTFAELIDIAKAMKLNDPLICENGGVIAVPESTVFASNLHADRCAGYLLMYPGDNREHLLDVAHGLRKKHAFRFHGFADWTEQEVSHYTGLPEKDAMKAKCRHATEPILWEDSLERKQAFKELLETKGLQLVEGGKFSHVMGQITKRISMSVVLNLYTESFPETKWTVLALGDSENDLEMISAADIAGVIPDAAGNSLKPSAPRVIHTEHPGPRGWNEIVENVLCGVMK